MSENENTAEILEETTEENSEISNDSAVKKKKYFTTARIAYLAMFVALNIVVSAFSPRIGSLKVTFTYTICLFAGYFFGAIAGGLVGGIGDVLGCVIAGYTPNPIILIASILLGVIPGLIKLIKIQKFGKFLFIFHIVVSFILEYVICTLFINTAGLYVIGMAKGSSYFAYMGIRALSQLPVVAINLGITIVLFPVFKKIYELSDAKSRS